MKSPAGFFQRTQEARMGNLHGGMFDRSTFSRCTSRSDICGRIIFRLAKTATNDRWNIAKLRNQVQVVQAISIIAFYYLETCLVVQLVRLERPTFFFFFIPNHPIFKAIKYSSIRFENRMISLMHVAILFSLFSCRGYTILFERKFFKKKEKSESILLTSTSIWFERN